jgi:Plasmid pRiA4b ORF-3-like protein
MPAAMIARLKVTITGSRPPIWRRLEVPLEFSFARLSDVILAAFGWSNSHLHEFRIGRYRHVVMADVLEDEEGPITPPDWLATAASSDPRLAELGASLGDEDERALTLAQVLAGDVKRFVYTYDLGDDWEHAVAVEAVLPAEAGLGYPRCTAGRRACPPEDCGGVWGYEHLAEVLTDPAHEEYAELHEWCPFFAPEEFDLAAADEVVRHPPEYWQ